MNVTELYRELKMTKEEFFPLVRKLGFGIGERAIKIDDRVALKIIDAIKNQHKQEAKKSIFAEEKKEEIQTALKKGDELTLPSKITVRKLADKMQKSVPDMIAILMRNGVMATINETLDYDVSAIIAEELGFRPIPALEDENQQQEQEDRSAVIAATIKQEQISELQPRPPVVVVMGHVDHGKTKLLDAIRKANVAEKEAGGITQHIGAYQVEKKGRQITFIDTPGHEAFSAMRSRGARVADLAILVIAADDGIKPQTIEAIHILQEAKLPFIVAINKIDKPEANIERVKKSLAEINLNPEDYGGKTICVPISAKANLHIDELLETLLLVADMEAEQIRANPNGKCVGTVIEAHVDKHKGPVATVIIQNGTLKIGEIVKIGRAVGRVRAMKNWQGDDLTAVSPAVPAQVLGLRTAPVVGDILEVATDKKILKQKTKSYNAFAFLKASQTKNKEEDGKKKLNIVLRADKLGSLEAIVASLENIKHAEVRIEIVQKGLGAITENDVLLAQSTNAQVYGFNVSCLAGAEKCAHDAGVEVHNFAIIYQIVDHVKAELGKLLSKEIIYTKAGVLKILAVFRAAAHSIILGGRVEDGKLETEMPIKILRAGKMIGEGIIKQLQINKKNVGEVNTGAECGLRLETETTAVEAGDIIEAYHQDQKERTLGS